MTIQVPVDKEVLAVGMQTTTPPLYQRVLIAVADADQVGPVVELARRAGVREARVLHLNLRESYGGRRFPLETDAAAALAIPAACADYSVLCHRVESVARESLPDSCRHLRRRRDLCNELAGKRHEDEVRP